MTYVAKGKYETETHPENISARRRTSRRASGSDGNRRERDRWCSGRVGWAGLSSGNDSPWSRTCPSRPCLSRGTASQTVRGTRPTSNWLPSPVPAFRAPPLRSTGPFHRPDLSDHSQQQTVLLNTARSPLAKYAGNNYLSIISWAEWQ